MFYAALPVLALPTVVALVVGGCAKDDGGNGDQPNFSLGGAGSGNGAGGATGLPSAGNNSHVNSGGQGVTLPPAQGGGNGTAGAINQDASCATSTAKADLTPVNMFVQFDRSGSMSQTPSNMAPTMAQPSKWDQASLALNGFFSDPASAGLRVALRFFPDDHPVVGCWGELMQFGGPPGRGGAGGMQPGRGGGPGMGAGGTNGMGGAMGAAGRVVCDAAACQMPLVPLGELKAEMAPTDAQEAALIAAVAASTPVDVNGGIPGDVGGTPMYPALKGAVDWATAAQASNPNERYVVVLVTDGDPSGCDTNINNIAMLAQTAYSTHQIPTYVVGIQGANRNNLNAIAKAGGTMQAAFAGAAGGNVQQDLINALQAIRGNVLSCDFAMPKSQTSDMSVDPGNVNVNFTPTGGMAQVVGKTTGADACQSGGWYYDVPAAPTKITLCPDTCKQVQADSQARIDIVLGCKTEVIIPK